MSETIKVIITAVETVRLERVVEISSECYSKYRDMIECGADQVDLTIVFGGLLREPPDVVDSLGLEDLRITPAPVGEKQTQNETSMQSERHQRGIADIDYRSSS